MRACGPSTARSTLIVPDAATPSTARVDDPCARQRSATVTASTSPTRSNSRTDSGSSDGAPDPVAQVSHSGASACDTRATQRSEGRSGVSVHASSSSGPLDRPWTDNRPSEPRIANTAPQRGRWSREGVSTTVTTPTAGPRRKTASSSADRPATGHPSTTTTTQGCGGARTRSASSRRPISASSSSMDRRPSWPTATNRVWGSRATQSQFSASRPPARTTASCRRPGGAVVASRATMAAADARTDRRSPHTPSTPTADRSTVTGACSRKRGGGAVGPSAETAERRVPTPSRTSTASPRQSPPERVSAAASTSASGGCDRTRAARSRSTARSRAAVASSTAAPWPAPVVGRRRRRRSPSQVAIDSTGPVRPNSSMVGECMTAASTAASTSGTANATSGNGDRATAGGASGNRTSGVGDVGSGCVSLTMRWPSPSGCNRAAREAARSCNRVAPTSTTSPTVRGRGDGDTRTPHTRVPFGPPRSRTVTPVVGPATTST